MILPKNNNILLIVTGGIAAYKALELVRLLRDSSHQVRVVMTEAAQQFVGPLSFQALSGNPVMSELLDADAEAGMGHIELARWAGLVAVVPASADFIARMAHGIADDLASTICLATDAPVFVAPAMNQQMWRNAATQANIATLQSRAITIIGPASGTQACGDVGFGRLSEPQEIWQSLVKYAGTVGIKPGTLPGALAGALAGANVLITAGPTQEAIDPVRYVSNRSSGKMGYALARSALEAGASVTLVSGPTSLRAPSKANLVPVVSAADMYQAVMNNLSNVDIFIAAAAVADYTISQPSSQKRKKSTDELHLTLTSTQDILKAVAGLESPPFCVGFAAETQNLASNASDKLRKKSLDMIAANDVSNKAIGFDSDDNEMLVLWHGGEKRLRLAHKDEIARQLIQLIAMRHAEA